MAYFTTTTPNSVSIFGRISAAVGEWFVAYARTRSRTDEVEFLEAKSDAELAKLGIKREDILRHVFRDLMHI